MSCKLIALHGYTQNGSVLRRTLGALFDEPDGGGVLFPDAPHACDEASVAATYAAWRIEPPPPPHLTWWRATGDGRIYEGWEATREMMRVLLTEHEPALLFGFSQGAMLAAAAAALSARGEFPRIRGVILVAGAVPRAELLKPLFETRIRMQSLHVWGDRDAMARVTAPQLAQCFDADLRKDCVFAGSHTIPSSGDAARAIAEFAAKLRA